MNLVFLQYPIKYYIIESSKYDLLKLFWRIILKQNIFHQLKVFLFIELSACYALIFYEYKNTPLEQ